MDNNKIEIRYLDKNNLKDYLNWVVLDDDNNHAVVTREWYGDYVFNGIKRGYKTYKYENITYGEPFIKPIYDNNFNKKDDLKLLYRILGDPPETVQYRSENKQNNN